MEFREGCRRPWFESFGGATTSPTPDFAGRAA